MFNCPPCHSLQQDCFRQKCLLGLQLLTPHLLKTPPPQAVPLLSEQRRSTALAGMEFKMLHATLLILCTQPRDCPPERSEGTQNLRTEIFHYVQNDKSVGGVIAFGPYGRCHSLQCHTDRREGSQNCSEVSLIVYCCSQP